MGIFSKIFGTDSAINKGLDMVASAGDKAFFTSEEKSDYKLKLLKAYEPFKLLQRVLVTLFCVPYVVLHCVVIILAICGVDSVDAEAISTMINNAFGLPVSAAVALYLTGGVLEGGFNARK